MFSPFQAEQDQAEAPARADNGTKEPADAESLDKLKAQVDQLQKQLDAISKESQKD